MVAVEFEERVAALATKIKSQRASIKTEEATKNALSCHSFRPSWVTTSSTARGRPRVIADVGMKKGEKIDYAILRDGEVPH